MSEVTQVIKPWYKKWWGVVICILFWPITLTIISLRNIWYKTTWKKLYKLVASVGVIILFLGFYVKLLTPSSSNSVEQSQPPTIQPEREVQTQPSFDVPSLIGKDVDEVSALLGAPVSDNEPSQQQLDFGTTEWNKSFKKGNLELLVTYNPSSRKVLDLFIGTMDPSGKTNNTQELLTLGNLSEGDPHYTIEFVKVVNDPTFFTGVKAIPAK